MLNFDMHRMEVRVVYDRLLCKGDVLTFFYPSTEWDMTQLFECMHPASAALCLRQECDGYSAALDQKEARSLQPLTSA